MVQKEVKKRTTLYGTVAVLCAIVLVSTIYVFGAAPMIFPPNNTPLVAGMKTFSSSDELKTFIADNSERTWSYGGGPLDNRFFGAPPPIPMPASTTDFGLGSVAESGKSSSYSTTNIQVAGVDEADTVKTDGEYLYTTSVPQTVSYYTYGNMPQSNSSVYIVKADPQNPKVVSKIQLGNGTQPAGLFLSPDGSKLTVLASKYQTFGYYGTAIPESRAGNMMLGPYHADVYTYMDVYDVSNKAAPVLTRNFTVSGSYFNSRMIGNYIYAVVSQPALVYRDAVTLPVVYDNSVGRNVEPSSIFYADMNNSNYLTFTSFYGLDTSNSAMQPTNMTVMMNGASTMYVSPSNIYVTYPMWNEEGSYTSIYKVGINGLDLKFEAQGTVPGTVKNQYALDEYNGNLRLATNWQGQTKMTVNNQVGSKMNNIYVLNGNLSIVGRLEGLAPNENLHSTRFMGDKGYLVTFKNTDPLFVIDLSQPTNPTVLGQLKIPGYSDYLHPYDSTHLIGVGKEAVEAEEGDFAWYQGLKLALFDVGDVNNPKQLSNYVIGDRGTDSAALSDPKAFLFDRSKGLLVIPVNLAIVREADKQLGNSAYGSFVWQGAYVFNVSVDGGFALRGNITHVTTLSYQDSLYYGDPVTNQNNWITRSLYIDNTLYTISNTQIKLNSLTNLQQIATVNLT